MRLECSKPQISEYNFLRLLSSTLILKKQDIIIKKYDLEKKLYDFYDNPKFRFLFEDICKRDNLDNNYIDLNVAFETAYVFGLLILIQDNGDVRSIINLTEDSAKKIISEFDQKEIIAMSKLCDELKSYKKDNYKVLTKTIKNHSRKVLK